MTTVTLSSPSAPSFEDRRAIAAPWSARFDGPGTSLVTGALLAATASSSLWAAIAWIAWRLSS